MSIFMAAASMDKQTALKLIREAHCRGWIIIRDDLIEQYKHTFNDKELKSVLVMIEWGEKLYG